MFRAHGITPLFESFFPNSAQVFSVRNVGFAKHTIALNAELQELQMSPVHVHFVRYILDSNLFALLTAVFKNVDAARVNKKFTTYMQNLR